MKFLDLGFSPKMTATEAIVQSYIDANLLESIPAGLDLNQHYMSDRQCLKRMTLKRANTISVYPSYEKKDEDNGDYLTDEDANKMIYGTDLKKERDVLYQMFLTDNEDIDPTVVSDKLDGVKTDRSSDDDSDSPFKPVRREDKSFEEIYILKKQLRSDFLQLQYRNNEFEDDILYLITLLGRASSFVHTSYTTPSDYKIDSSNTASPVYSPITAHPNFSISAIYSLYHSCKMLIRENRKKIGEIPTLLNYSHYIDFLVKPESLDIVNAKLGIELTRAAAYKVKFEAINKFVEAKLVILLAAQVKLETYDETLKSTPVSFFAPNPSGTVNSYSVQRSLYDSFREKIENDKQKLIEKLNKELDKGLNGLKVTIL